LIELQKELTITRLVRRLRGGSQAWQVQCEDGRFYVAKFAGNPQSNRSLANDWIVSHVMKHLGISTPTVRVLHLPSGLQASTDLYFTVGDRRIPVHGEFHFGSMYPVNPETTAIFDFLPQNCFGKVENLPDFARTWVLDKWLYQTDKRQSVFARARAAGGGFAMRAYMIDNGMCLGGSSWELHDEQLAMPDWNQQIYRKLDMNGECTRFAADLEQMDGTFLTGAFDTVPQTWLRENDRRCLTKLMQSAQSRRRKLPQIIARHLTSFATLGSESTPKDFLSGPPLGQSSIPTLGESASSNLIRNTKSPASSGFAG